MDAAWSFPVAYDEFGAAYPAGGATIGPALAFGHRAGRHAATPPRTSMRDDLLAGLVAAAVSGAPSTAWTLLRREDLLESGRAAGAILLPGEQRTGVLLVAAVPVHLGLSLGWAAVLARVLPRGREPVLGAVAGLAIAALDLGAIGRRIPAIRALPQGRQWADHLAFGVAVGLVLRARRR